uniref:RNase H type-1 domain-containing protein n=1 Tax=Tanacetum cinerariifolium TaxID=118510 RepID=A0A699GKQ3_TANCI|nr:hypothetical protein [Tanacetum cinerariifolium]
MEANTDGVLISDGSRAGLMLVSPHGKEYNYALRFESETTNNEAKYEALLAGLHIVVEMKIQDLAIFVDSQLVTNQVKGLFEAIQPVIKKYLEKTKEIVKSFNNYSMEHVRDPQRVKKLRIKAPQYRMIDDKLHRKSYLSPWLRCVGPIKMRSMPDPFIHTKESKARDDAYNFSMAFSQWGIDIVGPLPMALGGARFLVVAIDYFTKWVEAKPLVSTIGKYMEKFVKVTNRDIVKGMKRRLGKTHQGWMDALPQVLWTHRTTSKYNNGKTPFTLVYGSESVVTVEIIMETKRIKEFKVR